MIRDPRIFHKIERTGQDYLQTRQLFLRLLGVIYFVAFVSLWVQVEGLIGSNGILPIGEFLESAESQIGPASYRQVPTLFWLNHSDTALHLASAAGVIGSLMLIAGLFPGPAALVLWLLYLTLTTAGQVFLGFQWDNLLLETGLLAVFFAPWQARPTWQTPGTLFSYACCYTMTGFGNGPDRESERPVWAGWVLKTVRQKARSPILQMSRN